MKRAWPGVHVRLEKGIMARLQYLAKRDHRSIASEATHLLTVAVLSMAIKEAGK